MKNYNEMANDVLHRIGEHEIERRNRRKTTVKIVTSLCCFCLVALLGFGMWRGGMLGITPPVVGGEPSLGGNNSNPSTNSSINTNDDKQNPGIHTSTPENNDGQNNTATDKKLFAINEINGTVGAAPKYRDPALHYNEMWNLAKAATYLGVDIPEIVASFPDGDSAAGFPQVFDFKYVTGSGFEVIYENSGTLVEDRLCFEFTGENHAKITILASKLGMPYDCLYSSDTDDITNIHIPSTGELIPVLVFAQGKTDTLDYTLYVADFEYSGVFYRIRLENLTCKHLDTLIREMIISDEGDKEPYTESHKTSRVTNAEPNKYNSGVPDERKMYLTAGQSESLSMLFKEAENGGILVGTNGNKVELDATYSAELYASLEKFHATEEGHLYDGLIDAYVFFSDGTIFGVYSSPVQFVPDKYASCKGLMYGVVYKVDENNSVANFVYGFCPIEALDIPLQDIG